MANFVLVFQFSPTLFSPWSFNPPLPRPFSFVCLFVCLWFSRLFSFADFITMIDTRLPPQFPPPPAYFPFLPISYPWGSFDACLCTQADETQATSNLPHLKKVSWESYVVLYYTDYWLRQERISSCTGKNNGFPFPVFKELIPKKIPNLEEWDKSLSGNLVGNSLFGTCVTLPNLGFLWVFFKYPKISKNGIRYFSFVASLIVLPVFLRIEAPPTRHNVISVIFATRLQIPSYLLSRYLNSYRSFLTDRDLKTSKVL